MHATRRTRARSLSPAPSLLDQTEALYREDAARLCERAGITEDDLRMRLAAVSHQIARIQVYRQVDREGWRR